MKIELTEEEKQTALKEALEIKTLKVKLDVINKVKPLHLAHRDNIKKGDVIFPCLGDKELNEVDVVWRNCNPLEIVYSSDKSAAGYDRKSKEILEFKWDDIDYKVLPLEKSLVNSTLDCMTELYRIREEILAYDIRCSGILTDFEKGCSYFKLLDFTKEGSEIIIHLIKGSESISGEFLSAKLYDFNLGTWGIKKGSLIESIVSSILNLLASHVTTGTLNFKGDKDIIAEFCY